MPLRQTTGSFESFLRLVGLNWAVLDFSTLDRRQETLHVSLPYRGGTAPLTKRGRGCAGFLIKDARLWPNLLLPY